MSAHDSRKGRSRGGGEVAVVWIRRVRSFGMVGFWRMGMRVRVRTVRGGWALRLVELVRRGGGAGGATRVGLGESR